MTTATKAMTDTADRTDVWADGAIGVAEAEAFAGLGKSTLYELMTSGELVFTRVGARRLIARRSLVALLARNATHPDSGE